MIVTPGNRFNIAPETKLWRYMSFAKFISMLNTKQMLYVPAFRFEDPFEGACGIAQEDASDNAFGKNNPYGSKERRYTFFNCWHENEVESEAMWKLYTRFNPEGVAIQTTYKRLKEETAKYPFLKIGRVSYVDYSQKLDVPDSYFWYKRKSFEHEREVRVMTALSPNDATIAEFEKKTPKAVITRMVHTVSLENLIENVYVSPLAPNWFREVVKDELRNHGLAIEPIQSALNAKPDYEIEMSNR